MLLAVNAPEGHELLRSCQSISIGRTASCLIVSVFGDWGEVQEMMAVRIYFPRCEFWYDCLELPAHTQGLGWR